MPVQQRFQARLHICNSFMCRREETPLINKEKPKKQPSIQQTPSFFGITRRGNSIYRKLNYRHIQDRERKTVLSEVGSQESPIHITTKWRKTRADHTGGWGSFYCNCESSIWHLLIHIKEHKALTAQSFLLAMRMQTFPENGSKILTFHRSFS